MGMFDKFKDKAKGHIDKVKGSVSKQDFVDLITDAQRTVAEGKDDDITKMKAYGKVFKGLGQMAMGKYESKSKKLETVHKDPYDIQMAQETKDELNEILVERLNPRKFIYGSPDVINSAGHAALECINFIDMVRDETLLPRIHEMLRERGVHFDEATLDSEINKFIRDKEVTNILAIRHQVDKFVFIDRLTKAEIVGMYDKYCYNIQKHYHYQCEYCHKRFIEAPRTGLNAELCQFHPFGHYKGPHKVHSIGENKLWVD